MELSKVNLVMNCVNMAICVILAICAVAYVMRPRPSTWVVTYNYTTSPTSKDSTMGFGTLYFETSNDRFPCTIENLKGQIAKACKDGGVVTDEGHLAIIAISRLDN